MITLKNVATAEAINDYFAIEGEEYSAANVDYIQNFLDCWKEEASEEQLAELDYSKEIKEAFSNFLSDMMGTTAILHPHTFVNESDFE